MAEFIHVGAVEGRDVPIVENPDLKQIRRLLTEVDTTRRHLLGSGTESIRSQRRIEERYQSLKEIIERWVATGRTE